MDDAFAAHYGLGLERGRLREDRPEPTLELVRTLEPLARALPPPPADVLDVGGGPGVYAAALARSGYRVRLVDVVPLHVEQALDGAYGAVLLLGPLYHLTARDDRVRALREARRVTQPGGVAVAAAVSRFASLLDGLKKGFLGGPAFREIVERDLRDGQHRNPDPAARPDWFTTAYFHSVPELEAELRDAGFARAEVLGVEGPGRLVPGAEREHALVAARLADPHPELRCVSAHLLALARA